MVRNCPDCHSHMEMGCTLESTNGVYVQKKRKGLFKNTQSYLKAAVCTVCGHVTLYVENCEEYRD